MPHRLDHFNGYDTVVGSAEGTVVIHEQVCPFSMAGLINHLAGIGMLLLGNRSSCPGRTGSIEQALGKASPSAPDLQNGMTLLDVELLDDAIVLGKGGFFESGFFGGEDAA